MNILVRIYIPWRELLIAFSTNKSAVLKQNRITAIASENNLPLIALVQSVSKYFTKQHNQLELKTCRRASSFLNNFEFFTKVARYSEILRYDPKMASPAAQSFLVLQRLVELITPPCRTTQYSFRTKPKSFLGARHLLKWQLAR
jgi:hypothetical protein